VTIVLCMVGSSGVYASPDILDSFPNLPFGLNQCNNGNHDRLSCNVPVVLSEANQCWDELADLVKLCCIS
jgi:hypothetical protein